MNAGKLGGFIKMTNIIAIDYSMATQSMDIFFSGCNMGKHCPGCHNAEAWDFNVGKDWKQWIFQINDNVKKFGPMIKRIFILGGEPLDQDPQQFMLFMDAIKEYKKELWLFTRYELKDIEPEVRKKFDYIKTGPYKEELSSSTHVCFNVRLATTNQRIWKQTMADKWVTDESV